MRARIRPRIDELPCTGGSRRAAAIAARLYCACIGALGHDAVQIFPL
jgi:hypothetical protein